MVLELRAEIFVARHVWKICAHVFNELRVGYARNFLYSHGMIKYATAVRECGFSSQEIPYSGQASVVVSKRNDAGYGEAAIRSGHTTD